MSLRLSLLFILLYNTHILSAQSRAHTATQRAANLNVLYVGVNNPLEIATTGVDTSKMMIKFVADGIVGDVKKDASGRYIATANMPGMCRINIYDGPSNIISSEAYRCKRIPDPIATLGGRYRSGEIELSALKKQIGVVLVLENFDFEAVVRVESFNLSLSAKSGLTKSVQPKGPTLTEQMKTLLAQASPGDVVVISDIMITGPDGKSKNIPAIAFIVI